MKRETLQKTARKPKVRRRAPRGSLPGTWRINWHSRIRRWQCRIFAKGEKPVQVGTFLELINAVIARNVFLHERYGDLGLLLEWQRQHQRKRKGQSPDELPIQLPKDFPKLPDNNQALQPSSAGEDVSATFEALFNEKGGTE